MYYQLISDPVSLKSIDRDAACKKDASTFANRFDQMILNAKNYNKPSSTIFKDACRLHRAFQKAMKEELDFDVKEIEVDEDEDGAWARDLRQRGALAHYERAEFQNAQRLAMERLARSNKRMATPAEMEVKRFINQPLVIKLLKDKSTSACNTHEEFAAAHLGLGHEFSHTDDTCLLCPTFENLIKRKAKHDYVATPTFRQLIVDDDKKVTGRKRALSGSKSIQSRPRR